MQLPVSIPLRPSRSLALVLVLAHGAALALLWPLDLPHPLRLLLAAAILVSAWLTLGALRRPAASALHLAGGGMLELETTYGARLAATVDARTTVLPGLIVLLMRLGRRTATLVLLRDAMGADGHRRLRLWLRWRAAVA